MREEDLKAAWQQADVERPQPTVAQVRQAAATFQRRARLGDLIEYGACAVVSLGYGLYIWLFPSLRMKLASLAVVLATGFVAYQLRSHAAARLAPPDTAALSLLAFHRRELLRRRDLLKDSWKLFVAPLMAGMLVFVACLASERPSASLPLFVLFGAVLVMAVAISLYNIRQAGRVQRLVDILEGSYPSAGETP